MEAFRYHRPADVSGAIAALAADPDAAFLAGGTNLIDLMKGYVERPRLLVDLNRLPLARVEETPKGGLLVGALARNAALARHPLVRERYPVLAQALEAGASPQLRNRATVGGNLLQRTRCPYFRDTGFPACNKRRPRSGCAALTGENREHAILGGSGHCIAVHASDMAVALVALDAVVHVQGPDGARTVPLATFHREPGNTPHLENDLHRGELVVAVEVPPPAGHSHYLKLRDRASFAFALVSVAAALKVGRDGLVQSARVALGGVATRPWRAAGAEAALVGKAPGDAAFATAADEAVRGARPASKNGFKVELTRRAVVRALRIVGAEP